MHELLHGVHVLQPEDYRRMRWKNGRGMTTEIAVSPMDAALGGGPFNWRVSIAEVDKDCEFSRFPGYDRSLLLIEGEGMQLNFESGPSQHIHHRYVPFKFRGETQTYCRLLDGPVRDFNVMSRREKCTHTCAVFASPCPIHWRPYSESVLIYCLEGGYHLEGLQQQKIGVNKQQTLILDKRAELGINKNIKISSVSNDTTVVFVTIRCL